MLAATVIVAFAVTSLLGGVDRVHATNATTVKLQRLSLAVVVQDGNESWSMDSTSLVANPTRLVRSGDQVNISWSETAVNASASTIVANSTASTAASSTTDASTSTSSESAPSSSSVSPSAETGSAVSSTLPPFLGKRSGGYMVVNQNGARSTISTASSSTTKMPPVMRRRGGGAGTPSSVPSSHLSSPSSSLPPSTTLIDTPTTNPTTSAPTGTAYAIPDELAAAKTLALQLIDVASGSVTLLFDGIPMAQTSNVVWTVSNATAGSNVASMETGRVYFIRAHASNVGFMAAIMETAVSPFFQFDG